MESTTQNRSEKNLSLVINNADESDKINFDWIENFFKQMDKRYPFLWRQSMKIINCSASELKIFWFETLQKTTKEKFTQAVNFIFADKEFAEYPPHLARMNSLCRATPEDYNCLSEDEAYHLFTTREYKNSAPVYHAVVRLNTFAVYRMSAEKNRREFLKSYRKVLDEIKGGNLSLLNYIEPIALPRKEDFIGVEHKDKSQSDLMSSMRKSLGIKKL